MADRDDKFRWGQRENTRSNSPSREIENPTFTPSRQIEKPTLALSRGPENPTLAPSRRTENSTLAPSHEISRSPEQGQRESTLTHQSDEFTAVSRGLASQLDMNTLSQAVGESDDSFNTDSPSPEPLLGAVGQSSPRISAPRMPTSILLPVGGACEMPVLKRMDLMSPDIPHSVQNSRTDNVSAQQAQAACGYSLHNVPADVAAMRSFVHVRNESPISLQHNLYTSDRGRVGSFPSTRHGRIVSNVEPHSHTEPVQGRSGEYLERERNPHQPPPPPPRSSPRFGAASAFRPVSATSAHADIEVASLTSLQPAQRPPVHSVPSRQSTRHSVHSERSKGFLEIAQQLANGLTTLVREDRHDAAQRELAMRTDMERREKVVRADALARETEIRRHATLETERLLKKSDELAAERCKAAALKFQLECLQQKYTENPGWTHAPAESLQIGVGLSNSQAAYVVPNISANDVCVNVNGRNDVTQVVSAAWSVVSVSPAVVSSYAHTALVHSTTAPRPSTSLQAAYDPISVTQGTASVGLETSVPNVHSVISTASSNTTVQSLAADFCPAVSSAVTPSVSVDVPQTNSTSSVRAAVNAPSDIGASAGRSQTVIPQAANPIVVIRQLESVTAYTGETSWRTFKSHFERVAAANSWITEADRTQHLCLALHGKAAEILLDLDEHSDTAYADIWAAIRIRFGGVDDERDCMIRFDNRRQADTETLPEYAQTLRTLHRQAWPKAAAAERDSTLKRRFEDGVNSLELSQFLRLHTRTDNFEQTVNKARQFAETVDLSKTKKSVRIVESHNKTVDRERSTPTSLQTEFQPILQEFREILLQNREQNPAVRNLKSPIREGDVRHQSPSDYSRSGPEQRGAKQRQGRNQQLALTRDKSTSPAPGMQPRSTSTETRFSNRGAQFEQRPRSVTPDNRAPSRYSPAPSQSTNRPPTRRDGSWVHPRWSQPTSIEDTASPKQYYHQQQLQQQQPNFSSQSYFRRTPPRAGQQWRTPYPLQNQYQQSTGRDMGSRPPGQTPSRNGCWICGRFGCHSGNHDYTNSQNNNLQEQNFHQENGSWGPSEQGRRAPPTPPCPR